MEVFKFYKYLLYKWNLATELIEQSNNSSENCKSMTSSLPDIEIMGFRMSINWSDCERYLLESYRWNVVWLQRRQRLQKREFFLISKTMVLF